VATLWLAPAQHRQRKCAVLHYEIAPIPTDYVAQLHYSAI
jgi:hypothetical protein